MDGDMITQLENATNRLLECAEFKSFIALCGAVANCDLIDTDEAKQAVAAIYYAVEEWKTW